MVNRPRGSLLVAAASGVVVAALIIGVGELLLTFWGGHDLYGQIEEKPSAANEPASSYYVERLRSHAEPPSANPPVRTAVAPPPAEPAKRSQTRSLAASPPAAAPPLTPAAEKPEPAPSVAAPRTKETPTPTSVARADETAPSDPGKPPAPGSTPAYEDLIAAGEGAPSTPSDAPPTPPVREAALETKPEADKSAPLEEAEPPRGGDDCDFRALRVGEKRRPTVAVPRYVSTFRACSRADHADALATRSMTIGGEEWLLLVNPYSLSTRIQRAACWSCKPTTDEDQKDTRLVRAIKQAAAEPGVEHRTFLQNAGLKRGYAHGDFVTGDLCPSSRPLDRRLFETLAGAKTPTPIALSITGLWLQSHLEDFRWLQQLEREGKIDIVWTNHSFNHPYAPHAPFDHTFLLTDHLNLDFEILGTEQLLVAHGGVPSVFFRFPGLISSPALMTTIYKHHMISLGAEAWLAKGERPRDGSIILVHPNGNEEAGLNIFEKLYKEGKVSLPLEPLTIAP